MSKHKSIPTATRKKLYEKYNHRCAYCGCELEYKDMQIDHVESVYRNNDIAQTMSEKKCMMRVISCQRADSVISTSLHSPLNSSGRD